MIEALQLEARRLSWREGFAHEWALDAGQREWRNAFLASPPLAATVWNIGRQRGKTFDAVFLALETGVTKPNAIIRYCAKTKDSAVSIVKPAWDYLVATMPEDMKPTQGRTDYEWVFPTTGATFVLFGTDAQSFTKGRGPRTDLQFLDECGFYQDLVSVESALLPSLQTTGGRVLYLSTPSESVAHPYTRRIYAAMASGLYRHDTFWSNPRVNHEAVIEAERARLGMTREELLASTYFRREYLAEIVTDESRAAMPAWNKGLADVLIGDWERPAYFHAYQGHDAGITGDPHASLFAYLHFEASCLVIEDELELRSAANSIRMWVDGVKGKERTLYGSEAWDGTLAGAEDFAQGLSDVPEWLRDRIRKAAPKQPFLRVGDNATGICRDMTLDYGLMVLPTDKHEKAINADLANTLLAQRRVRIHRRCVRFIEQLYSTVWNKTRSEWERTDKDHGDLIDDFIYIVRNVRWHRDPRPPPPKDPYLREPATHVTGWARLVK